MWFKKKANISGFNPNTAYDGSDWRTYGNNHGYSISYTLPDAADAGNYFYLPALGNYQFGQLVNVFRGAIYWSSSAYPWDSKYAYDLYLDNTGIYVGFFPRYMGFRAEAFQ